MDEVSDKISPYILKDFVRESLCSGGKFVVSWLHISYCSERRGQISEK